MANAKYRPLGKYVLIKGKVKTQGPSGIVLPYQSDDLDEMLNRQKEIYIEDEVVVAVGPDFKGVTPGDTVHTFKKGLKFINKKKCEEFQLPRENDEVYYLIDAENILAIVS
jgi:co-chaperonin GroES (HSP10)